MWVADDRFLILGVVYRVVCEDNLVAVEVRRVLGSFERTTRPARAANTILITARSDVGPVVHIGCRRFPSDGSLENLMSSVIAVINNSVIGQVAQFSVHSAVVGWEHNVLAFPAVSGGGKSTLAAALTQLGFTYFSDEALVLDSNSTVLSYPKPISLSPESCELLGLAHTGVERLVMAEELGGESSTDQNALTHIVLAVRGLSQSELETLPRSQGVTSLLSHSFNHYKDPEGAFLTATKAASGAEVWQLSYTDPRKAAELIRSALGSPD